MGCTLALLIFASFVLQRLFRRNYFVFKTSLPSPDRNSVVF